MISDLNIVEKMSELIKKVSFITKKPIITVL